MAVITQINEPKCFPIRRMIVWNTVHVRGLTRTEAAKLIGVTPARITSILKRHQKDNETWVDNPNYIEVGLLNNKSVIDLLKSIAC